MPTLFAIWPAAAELDKPHADDIIDESAKSCQAYRTQESRQSKKVALVYIFITSS